MQRSKPLRLITHSSLYNRPANKTNGGKTGKKEARQWLGTVSNEVAKSLDYSGDAPPITNGVNYDEERDVNEI